MSTAASPAKCSHPLRVCWRVHLARALGMRHRMNQPWHTHAYRTFRSLAGDPSYSPAPPSVPVFARELDALVLATLREHTVPASTSPAGRRILMDVSFTARHDNKTGIQRVIRNLAREFGAPGDDRSILVVEIKDGLLHPCPRLSHPDVTDANTVPVTVLPGDILLLIDSGWGGMNREYATLLPLLHERGVVIVSVVYDLIPILQYEYYHTIPGFSRDFAVWIGLLLAYSRSIIAISQATQNEFAAYLNHLGLTRRPALDYFHLGFDQVEIKPHPKTASGVFALNPVNLLMVGVLDNRKGHATALAAFDRLRHVRSDVALHIIGKRGWIADETIGRIETHPLLDRALFWHAQAPDSLLAQAYEQSTLLIAASHAEGFGLPLIEAAQKDLPIVASNLPVFAEIAGDHVYYFNVGNDDALAATIETALAAIAAGTARRSSAIPVLTWKQSGDMLLRAVRARL